MKRTGLLAGLGFPLLIFGDFGEIVQTSRMAVLA